MAAVPVILNKGGGAIAADPKMGNKVAAALEAAGIDAEIELVEGDQCADRCRAVAEQGDPLLIVGGGDGTINAAASAIAGPAILAIWREPRAKSCQNGLSLTSADCPTRACPALTIPVSRPASFQITRLPISVAIPPMYAGDPFSRSIRLAAGSV